ncbi:hypothetical protein V6N13_096133 [Hibiscus sabdariffa]
MTSTSFMVGLKSPNDTHKKSERHETCGSAPPARKAWSHEGPSDVADPRTGIRFAIDPPDWLEEPIAKRHTTLPKPFTSFGFSTQIPLQSWSNNANAQPSYGGLSSPTISFLYVPANYHEVYCSTCNNWFYQCFVNTCFNSHKNVPSFGYDKSVPSSDKCRLYLGSDFSFRPVKIIDCITSHKN